MATRYNIVTPVRSGEGDSAKTFWKDCGVAFPHKGKEGFSIILHAFPVNGELMMFPFEPKEESFSEPKTTKKDIKKGVYK